MIAVVHPRTCYIIPFITNYMTEDKYNIVCSTNIERTLLFYIMSNMLYSVIVPKSMSEYRS